MVGREYPNENGLSRKKRATERLPVAMPEHLAAGAPSNRSHQAPSEDEGQRIVQPYDDIGARAPGEQPPEGCSCRQTSELTQPVE